MSKINVLGIVYFTKNNVVRFLSLHNEHTFRCLDTVLYFTFLFIR